MKMPKHFFEDLYSLSPSSGGSHDKERDGDVRLVAAGPGHAVPQPVLQQRDTRVLRALAVHCEYCCPSPSSGGLHLTRRE